MTVTRDVELQVVRLFIERVKSRIEVKLLSGERHPDHLQAITEELEILEHNAELRKD